MRFSAYEIIAALAGLAGLGFYIENKKPVNPVRPVPDATGLRAISLLGVDDVRAVRNNNPGNLRISASNWRGKIPIEYNTDGEFEQFESVYYGVRAMLVLLRNYHSSGRQTITEIVERYAPAVENPTDEYIVSVANCSGFMPNDRLQRHHMYLIAYCMHRIEAGKEWLTLDDFRSVYYQEIG
jgi:hypothetical protein